MSDNKKVSGSMLAYAIDKMLDLLDDKADQTEVEKKANASDLAAKQDKLTFDSTPTANSNNPVTSGGVKTALDNKADEDHIHENAVTVEGGASLSMTDVFGEGPYVIEITEDEDSDGRQPIYEEIDPTVPAWAKEPNKPVYTAAEVGAPTVEEMNTAIATIPTPDVSGQINAHNEAADAHADIRTAVTNAQNKADSAYNLASGKADPSSIPTKTSQLNNDSGFITSAPVSSVNGKTGAVQLSASDVGASAEGHNHTTSEITDFPTSMTPTTHDQSASTITAGTFAGQVVANANGQAAGTSLLRNSKFTTDDSVLPTVEGEIVWVLK